MLFEMMHPADQIVLIIGRIYKYGMTTTSGGNLSILDPNGDIWITPGGIDKGTLTRKDIIQVRPDGTIIGIHKPSVELPFHQQIYKARLDIKAIVHAHPPALVAFSIARKVPDISLIPNVSMICGGIGVAAYDVPGSAKLGEKIASVFKQGASTIIMDNHGTVIGASDLFKAFMAFETLDFCARLEINARQIGTPKGLSDKHVQIYENKQKIKLDEYVPTEYSSEERAYRYEMCDLIKRAYDQQLFTSTQGTFSRRIDDNTFIITPFGIDRKYLEPADIVKVHEGKREAGKNPSRSVFLHEQIYKKHPDINSIIIAHPPAIMSFAVTDAEFDSRTIPESYIMLREVVKHPFGSSVLQPELMAEEFSNKKPVAIVKNDCVIVTGNDLLNAFDRLEVMEFSAKALIAVKSVGNMVAISEKQVDEIETAFHLK
jgi:L-fuculose-phosphate aldolase